MGSSQLRPDGGVVTPLGELVGSIKVLYVLDKHLERSLVSGPVTHGLKPAGNGRRPFPFLPVFVGGQCVFSIVCTVTIPV